MPIHADTFIPDSSSAVVNTVEHNGSIKSLAVSAPTRTKTRINSLGGSTTSVQTQARSGDYELTLTIYDDYSKDRDTASLLKVLRDAYTGNTALTGFVIVPAGATAGMNAITYTNVQVTSCPPHGDMDADTEERATATVSLIADGFTDAVKT